MSEDHAGGEDDPLAELRDRSSDAFDHDDLETLTSYFDHEDAEVRSGAVWHVAELASADPAPVTRFADELAPRVDDPNVWVRRGATWALGEIAEGRPRSVRGETGALIDALDDADALVRENAIVAIENVALEYPETAAGALETLVTIVRNAEDPRVQRFAHEAIERITDRLEEARGDADVRVSLPAGYASHVPSRTVVEVDEDLDDEIKVHTVSGDAEGGGETAARRAERLPPLGGSGPPPEVPEPPAVSVERSDVTVESTLRRGPLLSVSRGRAEAGPPTGSIVVELREIAEDATQGSSGGDVAAATIEAVTDWARIDDHPAVQTTLGHGTRRPWLVTELADGRAFEAYAMRSSFSEALYHARQIVRAVGHAHGHDVVHGGLVPEAVGFVEPIEDAWHAPKVAEWGVALVVQEHLNRVPVPPAFAAPEHIAPGTFGAPDASTDIYGLGALLYALFAGRPPLEESARSVAEQLRNAAGGGIPADLPRPDPQAPYDDEVPEAARNLVSKALSRDRMSRYETVADLRRDLDRVIADHAEWA